MKRPLSAGDKILAAERADPIAFFRKRAQQFAHELRLRPSWVREGIPLVIETLGEDWLRAECSRRQPFMHRLDHGHEIAMAFGMGSASGIVLVLELALYLKHLADCPGFDEVVPQLRSDFRSTLLQLAHAYRIHIRGPQVRLEPPARDGRKGDIAFRWSGRDYLVECYARAPRPDVLKEFWSYTIPRILQEESCRTRPLRIVVQFHREPSDADRLAIERRVCSLCSSVQGAEPQHFEDESVLLAVSDLTNMPDHDFMPDGRPNLEGPHGDADVIASGAEVPIAMLETSSPSRALLQSRGTTRLMVYRPPDEIRNQRERVTELADRIERKLAQTRSAGTGPSRRMIIAQLERGHERETRHASLCRGLANRVIRRHQDVIAVQLCSRVWTADQRYRYEGTIITAGTPLDPLPEALGRWAIDTDFCRDILAGW